MRKRAVLSILEIPVRSNIIMRLDESGKAAYSDLLDSAGVMEVIDSRGNFNYHLKFLLENSIVVKEGVVYRLTDKGRAIAIFLKGVDQIWNQIEPKLRGGYMSITVRAEDFERETQIRMQKTKHLHMRRIEIIMDEKRVVCVFDEEKCEDEFFKNYEEIPMEDLKLYTKERKREDGKFNLYVFSHSELTYHLSPYYLGSVLHYLQTNFGEAHLFADKKKPMPFMLRAKKLQERYEGPAFMVAPVMLEPI